MQTIIKKHLDLEFGAAEILANDPLTQGAVEHGWAMYSENFSEDSTWCCRADGKPDGAFPLSGSKYSVLCVVYNPQKWKIVDNPIWA